VPDAGMALHRKQYYYCWVTFLPIRNYKIKVTVMNTDKFNTNLISFYVQNQMKGGRSSEMYSHSAIKSTANGPLA
jgi:hypothetical protein